MYKIAHINWRIKIIIRWPFSAPTCGNIRKLQRWSEMSQSRLLNGVDLNFLPEEDNIPYIKSLSHRRLSRPPSERVFVHREMGLERRRSCWHRGCALGEITGDSLTVTGSWSWGKGRTSSPAILLRFTGDQLIYQASYIHRDGSRHGRQCDGSLLVLNQAL